MDSRVIYAIQHNETKRMYIGITRNVNRRYLNHIYALRAGKHTIEDMQSDFNKYGENYSLFILEEVKEPEEADKEYEYMKEYQSYVRGIGYNYKDKVFAEKSVDVPLKPGKPEKIGGKT